ncbi:hypothetical protein ABZ570_20290 [Micromonospora sp. NPDC007271]|uniref:DUF7144 family membrane protein n=1 Tax=Micromonospora sp. NPDC007271 TaxID=3154587 RepID=UPI00340F66D5
MTQHDETRLRCRRRRLAGALLAGSGLFDGLAGASDLDDDRYVVDGPEGLLHLDLTGWSWAHLGITVLVVLGGVLLFTTRPWSVRLAAVAAVATILLHLVMLPFEPGWAVISIGLAVAALRLLWLVRRPSARADDVSGRPCR